MERLRPRLLRLGGGGDSHTCSDEADGLASAFAFVPLAGITGFNLGVADIVLFVGRRPAQYGSHFIDWRDT